MSERDNMILGAAYQPWCKELYFDRLKTRELLHKYNYSFELNRDELDHLLKEIVNAKSELFIEQPFYCTYGYNVDIGINFISKTNLTLLDSSKITIGNHVTIGANVTIMTTIQPVDVNERIKGIEYAKPVSIYDHVYIGTGSIIYPGVRINEGAIVQPGSIVKKDVPPYCIVFNNDIIEELKVSHF